MAPTNPKYLPKDTTPHSSILSTFTVLRASDQQTFVASLVADPPPKWRDPSKKEVNTPLAAIVISAAGISMSRILNHPSIISLVDIVQTSQIPGSQVPPPIKRHGEIETPSDFTVWEDMNAGCLSLLLPSPNYLPAFEDGPAWRALASHNYQRFSLPEGLCWHVLLSISKALLWLHWGVKETEGIKGDWMKHDDDWQPILIRDISPGQIWFKHPKGEEHYGECKLGGFQWAKVTGFPGAKIAMANRVEGASVERQYYWAPEIYKNTHSWTRASEIWSFGAVVYTMMTGIPPPRCYEYDWQISRMTDKGFSKGIRDVVARMLRDDMKERPDTLKLAEEVEDSFRYWRANTAEGMEYIDVRDDYMKRVYEGSQLGSGKLSLLQI